ncbi:MAG: S8 family serine peptidase [Gemmatimonadaceae bacterium]
MSQHNVYRQGVALFALVAVAACSDSPVAARPGLQSKVAPGLAASLAVTGAAEKLEVIINFDEGVTTSAAVVAAAQNLGAAVRPFKHLSVVGAYITAGQVAALSAIPGVTGVYPNEREPLLLFESVATIKADAVHTQLGITGEGVGIAIMDSGINGLHPDLAFGTKTVQNVKFTGDVANLYCEPTDPCLHAELYVENVVNTDNTSGHGTHVAGIAGGNGTASRLKYKGVAPGADLIGLAVGEGLHIINIMVLAAVDWMIDNRAKYNIQVVNNSWGGRGTFDPNDPVNESMRVAHDAGITVVFAAGNDGPSENTMNRRSVAPWVISVAAGCKFGVFDVTNSQSRCNDGRSHLLADFSSRGIPGDPLQHPDITAPGVRIVSARSYTGTAINALDAPSDARLCGIPVEFVDDYTCASGTSMASPHIAGVIALMEQASKGTLTPDQALTALRASATPMPGYGEWEAGAGYVNALAAVKKVKR